MPNYLDSTLQMSNSCVFCCSGFVIPNHRYKGFGNSSLAHACGVCLDEEKRANSNCGTKDVGTIPNGKGDMTLPRHQMQLFIWQFF